MKRGSVIPVALQGDYGKPRPALVIQSDLFSEHPSVTILPITSELRDAPLFRVRLHADSENGLRKTSEIMVDKLQTIPRAKAGEPFGVVGDETMLAVNRLLVVFLGLA